MVGIEAHSRVRSRSISSYCATCGDVVDQMQCMCARTLALLINVVTPRGVPILVKSVAFLCFPVNFKFRSCLFYILLATTTRELDPPGISHARWMCAWWWVMEASLEIWDTITYSFNIEPGNKGGGKENVPPLGGWMWRTEKASYQTYYVTGRHIYMPRRGGVRWEWDEPIPEQIGL